MLIRGVTRHLSHETLDWVHENETRFFDFKNKILNDEIYREKLSFIQLINTKS